jgi:transposase-like protein
MSRMLQLMKTTTPQSRPDIPNKPWNAAKAKLVLDEQAGSGLSLAAFARSHGIAAHILYAWRQRLAGLSERSEQVATFLPVRVTSPKVPTAHSQATLEVVLSSGTVVRVAGTVEVPQLTAVLRAVLETQC